MATLAVQSIFRNTCVQVNDSYTVLLREKKLPLSLLEDPEAKKEGKQARALMRSAHSFDGAFGKRATRKRPKIVTEDYAQLLGAAKEHNFKFEARQPGNEGLDGINDVARDRLFEKGQSRRIWAELYKVIDSSDVIIQVSNGLELFSRIFLIYVVHSAVISRPIVTLQCLYKTASAASCDCVPVAQAGHMKAVQREQL